MEVQENRRETYSTRLKTVTLFATGENRQVPSGLNTRFPWQYTVPNRLENLKSVFIVTICPWSAKSQSWAGMVVQNLPTRISMVNLRIQCNFFFSYRDKAACPIG